MRIAVLGATGTIGSLIVRELEARAHEAVPIHRGAGIDVTQDRDRLTEALAGCDAVVDGLNMMTLNAARAREFFTTAAREVMAAVHTAQVPRVVVISIAEADRPAVGRGYPYYAAKAAQERAYRGLAGGHTAVTVIRSTQWFELIPVMASMAAAGPVVALPTMALAPVAAASVAALVVDQLEHAERLAGSHISRTLTVRGPQELTALQVAEALQSAGRLPGAAEKTLMEIPYLGPTIAGGGLIPQHGVVDDVTLRAWIDRGDTTE
ncbi:MAG: SDR family oxidoreductase [Micrococcaceae bacterium]